MQRLHPVSFFAIVLLASVACALMPCPPRAFGQQVESFAGEEGVEIPEKEGPVCEMTCGERWLRAAKQRMTFAVANIFESRDIWRGIDWFVNNDPAYLLGGDFKLDLTPYQEQEKRDIWEVKLHSMVAGAWALSSGHENIDRWKVMAILENRVFKYLDFDIGYEHYGLPPFDDHDRDFEELILRAGFNAIPTFKEMVLPGYKKPITNIPFGVHYAAYYGASDKSFSFTNDKFGFHGYPQDWWWHNVEFTLLVPFPDMVPEKTRNILQVLKLDSQIWTIDRGGVLPGLPSGLQDVEFGMALPFIFDLGKEFHFTDRLCGVFCNAQFVAEPFLRYAIDAQNLNPNTGAWSDQDEIWGGVALVCAF